MLAIHINLFYLFSIPQFFVFVPFHCKLSLCNACGLRYARLIAKHERSQGKEELKQPFSKKPE